MKHYLIAFGLVCLAAFFVAVPVCSSLLFDSRPKTWAEERPAKPAPAFELGKFELTRIDEKHINCPICGTPAELRSIRWDYRDKEYRRMFWCEKQHFTFTSGDDLELDYTQ